MSSDLSNVEFRNRFYDETNRLMQDLEYTVVACVVRKDAHLRQYGIAAIDPYMLALRELSPIYKMGCRAGAREPLRYRQRKWYCGGR